MRPGPVGTPANLRTNRAPAPSMRHGVASANISTSPPAAGLALSGVISAAVTANPDLLSATERIRSADATLARARAEFYPTLSLTEAFFDTNIAGLAFFLEVNQRRINLSQNFNHPGFVGNFSTFDINRNSGGNGLFVGLIASINLFDGHRTKADVARASARVRELQAQHVRLLMDIELEVRRAYLALKDADGRLLVSGQAVTQADESVREIEDRYNDQKATITQLIDAQVAATNARVRRANAAADLEIARADLERVIGRLDVMLLHVQ